MIIDRISIGGIANIRQVSLKIDSLNALIAPNGYGKSNILRSIEFGLRLLKADENERRIMMNSRMMPVNEEMLGQDFFFELTGRTMADMNELQFVYKCSMAWEKNGEEGKIVSENLRMKKASEKRFRQMIDRSAGHCLIVPSPTGRCNKPFKVSPLQVALQAIAHSSNMYLSETASAICSIQIPNLETLDNPESYFSVSESKGIPLLGGRTLSEYLYFLKSTDEENYSILQDGILQMLPNISEFMPEVITLPDGLRKIYDIRIRERHCTQPTTILQLSSGSKRIIFLFTLCIAARKQDIPLIMMEEPENSVHPQLMENLLMTLQSYASNTKIMMTSHSPYLMRYLQPAQMYFGLPRHDGLAHFAKVNPARLKYLHRYAGALELTIGEFMFDFMLDVDGDADKLDKFFIKEV